MQIQRILNNDKAQLGVASALIQAANLLLLVLAKMAIPDAEFAFVLTNLAIAGIVGSIASMRLEVLVYQEHGAISFAAILMPIAAMIAVIALSFAGFGAVSAAGYEALTLSPNALPMMAGLGLSAIASFLFIQVENIRLLLALRCAQALALGVVMAALLLDIWSLNGRLVLLLIGASYAVPAMIWMGYFLLRTKPSHAALPKFYVPGLETMKRSGLLVLSTGVNSVYVNMPLLAAAATQSASFVADFGLIMRCFTAPITLIFQVIGRLFLAEAIRWSAAAERKTAELSELISRAMLQSVGLFLVTSPILFTLLYVFREDLGFSHLHIAPFLFLAALGQCAVNSVSQVRIPLKDERSFLIFDGFRLAGLAFGLYVLSALIAFEHAFSMTALALYSGYIVFIFVRVSKCAAR